MHATLVPEKCCPICGGEYGWPGPHRCPERTLAAIDGAHRRADEVETFIHSPLPPKLVDREAELARLAREQARDDRAYRQEKPDRLPVETWCGEVVVRECDLPEREVDGKRRRRSLDHEGRRASRRLWIFVHGLQGWSSEILPFVRARTCTCPACESRELPPTYYCLYCDACGDEVAAGRDDPGERDDPNCPRSYIEGTKYAPAKGRKGGRS